MCERIMMFVVCLMRIVGVQREMFVFERGWFVEGVCWRMMVLAVEHGDAVGEWWCLLGNDAIFCRMRVFAKE